MSLRPRVAVIWLVNAGDYDAPPMHVDQLVEHWTVLDQEREREELLKHLREERIEPRGGSLRS